MPNTLAAFLIALSLFPAQGPARSASGLDRALGAIRPQALAADLHFLACDELGGRDTPSEGLSVASLFLRARLQRLGLQPAGPDGFFDLYTLVERRLDPDASGLFLEAGDRSERFRFGSDYFLSRTSHVRPREARGPVVSAGSGAREEFETGALEGAWALVFDQGLSARRALRHAGEAGAVGVLLVDEGGPDRTHAVAGSRFLQRALASGLRALSARGLPRARQPGPGLGALGPLQLRPPPPDPRALPLGG